MRKELRKIIVGIVIGIGIVIGVYFLFVGGVYASGAGGRDIAFVGAYVYIPVGGIIIFLTVLGGILAYRRSHRE